MSDVQITKYVSFSDIDMWYVISWSMGHTLLKLKNVKNSKLWNVIFLTQNTHETYVNHSNILISI